MYVGPWRRRAEGGRRREAPVLVVVAQLCTHRKRLSQLPVDANCRDEAIPAEATAVTNVGVKHRNAADRGVAGHVAGLGLLRSCGKCKRTCTERYGKSQRGNDTQ